MHKCVRLRVQHVSTRTSLCAIMCAECVDTHDAWDSIYTYTCIHIHMHECVRLRVLHISTRTHFQTGCGTQGVLHMKDPLCVAVGSSRRCSCSGCYQALGPPNLVVAPVKPYKLSSPSLSHKCSIFFERHHALDAHTTNFYTAAICRFTEFLISPWFISPLKKVRRTKNRKSRNSCRVKVGGVGVMWVRLKDMIVCMTLPVLPPDLEVLPPATTYCRSF